MESTGIYKTYHQLSLSTHIIQASQDMLEVSEFG